MKKDSVLLVIPVYNEEACIEKVVVDWGSELTSLGIPFSILLIDDGSTDETPSILERISREYNEVQVINQPNQGHGSAVKAGYIEAIHSSYDFVFQTDSDDQFCPQDFQKLWSIREDSPAIFGHRVDRKDSLVRKFISFSVRKYIFDFFGVDIPDANIPFRLFKRSFLKQCLPFLNPGLFAPNIFLSIYSFSLIKKCPVVAVKHFARKGETQKLMSFGLFKACLKSFWQLVVFYYQFPKKFQRLSEQYSSPVIELQTRRKDSSSVAKVA